MKLTQYQKDAMVRSIWAEVPTQTVEQLKDEIQKAAVKAMSVPCRNLYKKSPLAIRTHRTYDVHATTISFVCGDADVTAVLQPFKDVAAARHAANVKLKAAIQACSTRKQFIDRFPEFSTHAPSEHAACDTLPAVSNVVADLVKLGLTLKVTR
jgi:hypothetical protein